MRTTTFSRVLALVLLTVLLGLAAPVFAQEDEVGDDGPVNLPDIDLEFKNFFLIQNDRDFDRTTALYDEHKQSVGYFATIFTPGLTWNPIEQVVLRYRVQIGENLWSRNNTEQRDPTADDIPTIQHKEIWADVALPGELHVRAGYQHITDPTRLFIDRDAGAASLTYPWAEHSMTLLFAQLPDPVWEGTTAQAPGAELEDNNFENDTVVYAVQGDFGVGDWRFAPAVWGLNDRSEIGREKNLFTGVFHTDSAAGIFGFDIDLALQMGTFGNAGIDNRDVDMFGYAGQLHFSAQPEPVRIDVNALFLSADDGDRNDLLDTGFTYSGWSKSATLLLSENELQDQYDNLDERIAAQRAGLLLVDGRVGVTVVETLELFAIGGYGRAVETANLDDDAAVGTEGDLGLTWTPYLPYVSFTVLGGGLWPGKSGAVVKNEIDLTATDTIYHGQALMKLTF